MGYLSRYIQFSSLTYLFFLRRKKRKGGKLDIRWLGPYIIVNNLGKGLYSLKLVGNTDCIVGRINGSHLKPYISSSSAISPPISTNSSREPACNGIYDNNLPLQTDSCQSSPQSADLVHRQLKNERSST